MNREDIIRMAREAGIDWSGKSTEGVLVRAMQVAYAAGAAAERDSWPAEMEAMERQVNILTDALAQAVAAEREACAKVCEAADKSAHPADLADAIRARGQA